MPNSEFLHERLARHPGFTGRLEINWEDCRFFRKPYAMKVSIGERGQLGTTHNHYAGNSNSICIIEVDAETPTGKKLAQIFNLDS